MSPKRRFETREAACPDQSGQVWRFNRTDSRRAAALLVSCPVCSSLTNEVMPHVAMISAYPLVSTQAATSPDSWPAAPFPSRWSSTRSAHSWRKRHSVPEGSMPAREVRVARRGLQNQASTGRGARGTARLHSRYAAAASEHDLVDRGRADQHRADHGRMDPRSDAGRSCAAGRSANCPMKLARTSALLAHQEAAGLERPNAVVREG
jgi:hypothetical protein